MSLAVESHLDFILIPIECRTNYLNMMKIYQSDPSANNHL